MISLTLRPCVDGEELLSSGKCKKCDPGQYLLQAPDKTQLCKECPSNKAECLGGNEIYPLPGFWRGSPLSEDFYTCLNNYACMYDDLNK